VARDAAVVTTVSIVRGAWEVRCVQVDPSDAPGWPDVVALRVGGWPISATEPPGTQVEAASASVTGRQTSSVVSLGGYSTAGVHQAEDATPLGHRTATPWLLQNPPVPHAWGVAALALDGGRQAPHATISGPDGVTATTSAVVTVAWPDGAETVATLPPPLPQ
jgi:hypothetical protein